MKRTVVTCLLLLLALLPVRGECQSREEAEAKNALARAAYDRHDFKTALALFKEAFSLHRSERYLFNSAKACLRLEDREGAVYYYERYLSLKPEAADRAQVGEELAGLRAELRERGMVEVVLSSTPGGARISMSPERRTEMAITPGSMFLAPGSYVFTFIREGYQPVTKTGRAADGATAPLTVDATLEKIVTDGFLKITCNEDGASVIVAGKPAGVTPLGARTLPAGDYRVRVVKTGFEPFDGVVKVKEGETSAVLVELKAVATNGDRKEGGFPWRTAALYTSIAGATVAAAGGVVFALGYSEVVDASDSYNPKTDDREYYDGTYSPAYESGADKVELGSWLLLAGAGVAAGAAAAYFLLPADETPVPVTFAPLANGFSASFCTTF